MDAVRVKISSIFAITALAIAASLIVPARAQALPFVISNPSGGDCVAIGTWSLSAHTCTLTTDITRGSADDGIDIASDGITLDGANHYLTGFNKNGSGVRLFSKSGVTVKNLLISQFSRGIDVWNSGTVTGNLIIGNTVYSNAYGISVSASNTTLVSGNSAYLNDNEGIWVYSGSSNTNVRSNYSSYNGTGLYLSSAPNTLVYGNTFRSNSTYGLDVFASNNSWVYNNNFDNNGSPARDSGSTGSTVTNNYWSTFDTPAEGCLNTTPFDDWCDGSYSPPGGGMTDGSCYILPGAWSRFDFTWYDNVGGSNWVLMGNRSDATQDVWMDLKIGGTAQWVDPLPGFAYGQVPPGKTLTPRFPGVMDGPVISSSRANTGGPIVSQRILWPAGGNSLEEVPGLNAHNFSNRFWWSWYDMASAGYKDWILVSNPNDFNVDVVIRIGDSPPWGGTVPARNRITPTFPGVIGGPVSVQAYVSGTGNPAKVMASQRVLMNGDSAFNELPGMPEPNGGLLRWDHVWTWYDMTGGAKNWILIANPTTSVNPIYYQIKIAGVPMPIGGLPFGGPIASGQSATLTFPGQIGGPVEVQTFFDAGGVWPAPSICSQRSLWGNSFEEVPGSDKTGLQPSYDWTWYDQKSNGSQNWVLVANPSGSETITATVSFTDQGTGAPQLLSQDLVPGGRWTPAFPGKMGGPVKVAAVLQGTANGRPVIASQRVLWNGYFNEVWGQ